MQLKAQQTLLTQSEKITWVGTRQLAVMPSLGLTGYTHIDGDKITYFNSKVVEFVKGIPDTLPLEMPIAACFEHLIG